MAVDKTGKDLEDAPGDEREEGVVEPRRRRRGGLRVPSDNVPRPTRAAPTPAPEPEPEPEPAVEEDVDMDFSDSDPAPVSNGPALREAQPSAEPAAPPEPGEVAADGEAEELADDDLVEDDRAPTDPPAAVVPVDVKDEEPPHPDEVAPVETDAAAPEEHAEEEPAEADELPSDELEEETTPAPVEVPAAAAKAPPAPPPAPAAKPPAVPKVAAAVAAAVAAEPRPKKRKARAWFEEIFDDDYLRTLPFLTPQATQREAGLLIEGLGLRPGQQVLDVGCGYGRHAMELAARGLHVVALDLSLPLLLRGADEAQRRGLTINFVHGDMRELSFEAQFDGAYCVFSSFGFFDDETNKRVVGNIARAIKPGGRFVLEVLNRDYIIADLPTRVWWEGDGCVVLEEVDFNYFTSRLISNRSVVFEDGRQLEQEISVRVYSLHEVGKLLHQAGFRVIEVSGGLAARGRFFGNHSRNLIVIAERKADSKDATQPTSTEPLPRTTP